MLGRSGLICAHWANFVCDDGLQMPLTEHRRITGKLVIATHNSGKLAEMRELLAPHGIEAISAGELDLGEPEETGESFRANAQIKAIAAAKSAQLPAFADDSGLVVDALDGAPGIYSARWAGTEQGFHGRDDADRTSSAGTRRDKLCATRRAFRFRSMRRLARRSSRRSRGARPGHSGMAAPRLIRASVTIRPSCPRTYAYLRRDDQHRETWPAAPGTGALASCPRRSSSWRRSALTGADAAPPDRGKAGQGKAAFGVYVHWPFCLSKCPVLRFQQPCPACPDRRGAIRTRLLRARSRPSQRGRRAGSVVDLPRRRHASLMQPQTVGAILDAIGNTGAWRPPWRSRWRPIPRASRRRASAATAPAGVNRVSLGVQALDDASLKAPGTVAYRSRGARRGRDRAYRLRSILVRPDLRPSRPDPGDVGR